MHADADTNQAATAELHTGVTPSKTLKTGTISFAADAANAVNEAWEANHGQVHMSSW